MKDQAEDAANIGKFMNPHVTAKGEPRAHVALERLETLWFNTGTLCNITCVNCYIDSSPTNDALVYLTLADVQHYLTEIDNFPEDTPFRPREIGFTGGEPFMNPQMPDILDLALSKGYEVLVLTNAMRPMQRPAVQEALLKLNTAYPDKLTLRVSLDHYSRKHHEEMRGAGSFNVTLAGMDWLRDNGIAMTVAARSLWHETDAETRAGFAALYAERNYAIDPSHPAKTVIFPEMDMSAEVPEITTACWGILGKTPSDIMCASQRMVVKRKGHAPSVVACTLLPYEEEFDLGPLLSDALGEVALNHPHCAKFCVLGGASCSA